MKKIIFFAFDMNIGGMEKALLVLLNQLVNKYEVTLVLEHKRGPLLNKLDKRVNVQEYCVSDIKFVPVRKVINLTHRLFWKIRFRNKFDFACSYATYSVIGSKLALIASTNTALYVHSNYYDYYKGNVEEIKSFFYLLNYRAFQHILFVSNESKDNLKNIFPEINKKGHVINNLIDYQEIENRAKEDCSVVKQKDSSKMLFLFVGRLEEESKRLSRLLEAFSFASSKRKDICLWIVGNGKDYELCQELIEKYELQSVVKMFGAKENPYPYIAMADCVILTSDFEGYPVIYSECMVLQKPIITTVSVSDPYLNIKDYAVIVEKDSKKVAEAIEQFNIKHVNYDKIDFQKINKKRISDLEEIIDGK